MARALAQRGKELDRHTLQRPLEAESEWQKSLMRRYSRKSYGSLLEDSKRDTEIFLSMTLRKKSQDIK